MCVCVCLSLSLSLSLCLSLSLSQTKENHNYKEVKVKNVTPKEICTDYHENAHNSVGVLHWIMPLYIGMFFFLS